MSESASPHGQQVFDVDGAQISAPGGSEAQRVLAEAHSHRARPTCLCVDGGVPMYIARVGDRFIVKRMPETGMVHATACPSYLPPEALSGLGQVLGGAIIEQGDTGVTALRLGFRMAKADRNGPAPASSGDGGSDSVTADGTRLGMRAVLHYLWQEADLATWSPAMAGKRNWRIVSWYLRQAARGKFTRGKPLAGRLFIPEPFSADHKADLAARRMSAWAPARAKSRSSEFMILIGEVETIEPARLGHNLVIKHLPDAPLMLDEDVHRRMFKRFADELELWQADDAGHLMVLAAIEDAKVEAPAPTIYGSLTRGLPGRAAEFEARCQAHGAFGSYGRSHAWTVNITCPDAATERCQPTVLSADLHCDCDRYEQYCCVGDT